MVSVLVFRSCRKQRENSADDSDLSTVARRLPLLLPCSRSLPRSQVRSLRLVLVSALAALAIRLAALALTRRLAALALARSSPFGAHGWGEASITIFLCRQRRPGSVVCSAPHSHKAVSSSVQSLTARAADATFACACTKKQTQKQEAKEQPTLQGKKNRRIFVVAVVVAVPSSSSSSNPPPPPQPAPLRKMSFRRRLKHKRPPAGWDKIEETIEDFEAQMRDVVAEGHEGERRAALSWKVHRVHWEKNRFIFDLVYVRKVMSRELVSFEFVSVCGGDILI